MQTLLSINRLYTVTNKKVPGFGSIAANEDIGINSSTLPEAAKRRQKLNTSGTLSVQIPSKVSYECVYAVTTALTGRIDSLVPVSFTGTDKDGGIMEVTLRTTSSSGTSNIAFQKLDDGFIFYSKQFIQSSSSGTRALLPNYHVPLCMLAAAYVFPKEYPDIIDAMSQVLISIDSSKGIQPTDQAQKTAIGLLADELSLGMALGSDPNAASNINITLSDEDPPETVSQFSPDVPRNAFYKLPDFTSYINASENSKATEPAKIIDPRVKVKVDFVGSLANDLADATMRGMHSLLTGPTETGKTLAVETVCNALGCPLFKMTGNEGLKDKDIIGGMALVDGNSQFIRGMLPNAMEAGLLQYVKQERENKAAEIEGRTPKKMPPAVLYIDEFNRMDTRHQNLFIGAVNVRYGSDDYYLLIPETGEEITCPNGYFVLIAARNFGMFYVGTNDMDLACVRRFHRKFDVGYLDFSKEVKLVIKQTGLDPRVAEVLCKVAQEIRMQASELQAPLGTGSLLEWGKELAYRRSCGDSISGVNPLIDTALVTWLEVIAGRDEYGAIDSTNKAKVTDTIKSCYSNVFKSSSNFNVTTGKKR